MSTLQITNTAMADGMSAADKSDDNIATIVTDALNQQASQFEAIFGGLQAQIASLAVKKSAKAKTQKATASSSSGAKAPVTPAPAPRKGPRLSNTAASPSASKSPPKTPNTPTPRKVHPLQVTTLDVPSDFQSTKEAFYVHIKMMWDLYRTNDVPTTPDAAVLKEFYDRFTSAEQVEWAVKDLASQDLIAQDSIMSLRALRVSGSKIARGFGHIDEISILYMLGLLAKTAIPIWGPDCLDAIDPLFNSACQINAIASFRQLLSSGTYNYMNVNLKYVNNVSLLISVYIHYVHFVMAKKFKAETKKVGATQNAAAKKVIQKNRERLRDARSDFFMRH